MVETTDEFINRFGTKVQLRDVEVVLTGIVIVVVTEDEEEEENDEAEEVVVGQEGCTKESTAICDTGLEEAEEEE